MIHLPVSEVELICSHYTVNFLANQVPDYKTQKQELQALLQQRLRKGDIWYECMAVV